jgi:hypothetical protein
MRSLISLLSFLLFTSLSFSACVLGGQDPNGHGAGLIDDDSDAGVCGGESVACFMLDSESCDMADGCAEVGVCTGYAARCGFWRAQDACERQLGCDWTADESEDGGHCGGQVASCSHFSDPDGCADQLNCHWELFCGGFATSCEERPGDDCEAQPGCRVDN